MKIQIEYPALVTNATDAIINDIIILESLNGKSDENANLSDYLSAIFDDLGVNGGQINLKLDSNNSCLKTVITYHIGEPLSNIHLQQLIKETSSQLSDGYGEDIWEADVNGNMFYISLLDILSDKKYPTSVSTYADSQTQKRLKRSPIFSAIEKGDIAGAKKHLNRSSIFSTDKWGNTPLTYAIIHEHTELAKEMVELGANVNHCSDKSGSTPLHTAAMQGNSIIGKVLIEYGADVNAAPKDPDGSHSGMTALMWAANRNQADFVKLLLENGADVNKVNDSNETAIMFANLGSPEQLEIFELLIKLKPILTVKDWRGRTIIDDARARATNSSKPEMMDLIQKYYPDVNFN